MKIGANARCGIIILAYSKESMNYIYGKTFELILYNLGLI
jgi:hypothetical protein